MKAVHVCTVEMVVQDSLYTFGGTIAVVSVFKANRIISLWILILVLNLFLFMNNYLNFNLSYAINFVVGELTGKVFECKHLICVCVSSHVFFFVLRAFLFSIIQKSM